MAGREVWGTSVVEALCHGVAVVGFAVLAPWAPRYVAIGVPVLAWTVILVDVERDRRRRNSPPARADDPS